MFFGKILITGGTGSFGNQVVSHLLKSDVEEIRILSRDEKKQDDMRKFFKSSKLKFFIGDVRDSETLKDAIRGVDYIYHAAALKQVPTCEFYPIEATKTNVLGTYNVLKTAEAYGVRKVVILSTDKAVYPINAMGISKALMEKVAVAEARRGSNLSICATRYGNVIASRGSVIPFFIQQIKEGKDLTITEPSMTRFLMSLDRAVDLVFYAFEHSQQGDIFIQKAPAATVQTIADALMKMLNKQVGIKIIGRRHGEKDHETLVSSEELSISEDLGDYFRIPSDMRTANYTLDERKSRSLSTQTYNSANTTMLDVDGVVDLLSNNAEVLKFL